MAEDAGGKPAPSLVKGDLIDGDGPTSAPPGIDGAPPVPSSVESRAARVAGAVSVGYAYQFVVLVSGLWLTRFLVSRLGETNYGLWAVGGQIILWISILDLGIVATLPRETAYAVGSRARGGVSDLPRLIDRTAGVVLWQLPAVVVTSVAVWLLIPARWAPLAGPLAIILATFVVTFPLRVLPAVLQGLQDLVFVSIQAFAAWAAGFVVTVVLVANGWGLYGLAAGWVVLQCYVYGSSWYRLKTRHRDVLPRRVSRVWWTEARGLILGGSCISLSQVAQSLVAGSDMLIIGRVLGPLAVTPYSITGKLIAALGNQPALVMQAALPGLAEIRGGADRAHLQRVASALSQAMLLVSGLVFCVVLVVNEPFIARWMPTNPYGGDLLTLLLLCVMLARHWNFAIVYTLFALGGERRIALTSLADGLVTVVASGILVAKLGVIGAPIGSILGVVLVSLPANLRAVSRASGLSVLDWISPLVGWTWRFGLLGAGAFLCSRLAMSPTIPALVATTGVVGLVVSGVMAPIALRPPLGVYVRARLARLLTS